MNRQRHHPHIRAELFQLASHLNPGQLRHVDIQQQHIRQQRLRFGYGIFAVHRLADDVEIRLQSQKVANPLPQKLMIVCNQDAYRQSAHPCRSIDSGLEFLP